MPTAAQGLSPVQALGAPILRMLHLLPYPAKSPPGRLRLAALSMVACGVMSWTSLHFAEQQMSQATRTVGHDAVPSIKASQDLESEITRMISTSAMLLLAQNTPWEGSAGIELETERTASNEMEIRANENVTYGPISFAGHNYPAERSSIVRIEHGLQDYLVQDGIAQHEGAAGPATLWDATAAVRSSLIVAAEDLAGNNYAHLDQDYLRFSPLKVIGLGIVSLLAVCAMLYPMIRIYAEIRSFSGRATLGVSLLIGFTIASTVSLRNDTSRLHVAKQDAFDSISVLSRADMLAGGLAGNTAFWMLLPGHREEVLQTIGDESDKMLAPVNADSKGGLLTQALANVSFDGGADSIKATQSAWMNMLSSSAQIRNLEDAHQHNAAIRQLMDARPGGFAAAYAQFRDKLMVPVGIKHDMFKNSIADNDKSLSWITWSSPFVFLIALGLIWTGIISREHTYA